LPRLPGRGGSQLPFCAARNRFKEKGVDFCFRCEEYPCGRNQYPPNLEKRQECGTGFPVTVRYHSREMGEGGIDPAGSAELGREFAAAGADILHISSYYLPDPALNAMMTIPATSIPGEDAPEGCFLDGAAEVKRNVPLPVIGVGKIIGPAVAEGALENKSCDLVAVGRALVADPDWPLKAGAGEEIRRCRSCKACLGSLAYGEMV